MRQLRGWSVGSLPACPLSRCSSSWISRARSFHGPRPYGPPRPLQPGPPQPRPTAAAEDGPEQGEDEEDEEQRPEEAEEPEAAVAPAVAVAADVRPHGLARRDDDLAALDEARGHARVVRGDSDDRCAGHEDECQHHAGDRSSVHVDPFLHCSAIVLDRLVDAIVGLECEQAVEAPRRSRGDRLSGR